MPSCREIDALVTPYIDGEATASERTAVEAHLAACPPCRMRAQAESAARQALRSMACRPDAPAHLRKRCSRMATPMGRLTATRSPSQLSAIAAAVMILGGVSVYGLTRSSPVVLAAQLTLDHVKCFALHGDAGPVDPAVSETRFAERYGWRVHVPSAPGEGLELIGVRRCFCGEGAAAHVMFRHHGEPLSLYIIPGASRMDAGTAAFGHDAVMWSAQDATYVLLGQESMPALQALAVRLK